MTAPRTRRQVLSALALAALCGCNSSPPPALYTLVARPGPRIDRTLAPIALRPVEVPKYLDRAQIVRRRTPLEFEVSDFERWGEGFDDMVTRVLLDDLALRLPRTELTIAGTKVAPQDAVTVALDLARFDADPGGTAVLEARWTIRRGATAEPVRLQRIAVRAAGQKTADIVAAMSNCLAQLADSIAAALAA
jgi:uncharacterized protein